MSIVFFTEINFISVFIVIVLLFNSKKSRQKQLSARLLRLNFILVISILCIDEIAWLLNGVKSEAARLGLFASNSLYFIITGLITFCWFVYITTKARNEKPFSTKVLLLTAIPAIIQTVLGLLSPWFGFFFTISEDNTYSRGSLFVIQIILSYSYVLTSSIISFIKLKKEKQIEKRTQYLYLGMFIIFPAIGSLIQTVFYGTEWTWPLVCLSLLVIYINIQNQQISLDGLTGINNRGQFNKFLINKCENFEKIPDDLFLLLMDINNFKLINDNFGHSVGDKALIDVSNLLKTFFGGESVFLARYGGDEFAVILNGKDEETIKKTIRGLNNSVYKSNLVNNRPYNLSLSIGYSLFGVEEADSPEKLIVRADKMMYENKRSYKKSQQH